MSDDPNEFQDPLENYDPKVYSDPLEEALAEGSVAEIRHEPMATVGPDVKVRDAIDQLAGLQVACLLVEEGGKLLGTFTDRDVLNKVSLEYEEVKDLPVKDVMAKDPIYIYNTDSAAAAFSVMAVVGYRHVPVLDPDHNLVGIVSPQRVVDYLQQHLVQK